MIRSILVADDEESNRTVMCEFFERYGYKVENVCDGLEALRLIRNRSFSLGIFDVMMPNLNGIELLEKIMRSGVKIPIVITTSIRTDEIKIEAISKGAAGFFYKPVELGHLRILVKSLIGEETSLSIPVSTNITITRQR